MNNIIEFIVDRFALFQVQVIDKKSVACKYLYYNKYVGAFSIVHDFFI